MHTVTGKLNKDARQHPNEKGVTFFITLGEQYYDYQSREKKWTNYDAAIFAKDGQIQFYTDNLKAGAIVSVGCDALAIEGDPNGQYLPQLVMKGVKVKYIHAHSVPMPNEVRQQAQGLQQAPPRAPQQAPQQQQAGFDNYDDDIPF